MKNVFLKKKFFKLAVATAALAFGAPVCGAETLPAVDFDFCAPDVRLSEIQRVFFAKVSAASFTDWTQAEEWNLRVSETSTDDDAIRALTVIGDKPAPAAQVKEISNQRKFTSRKDHTINITIDEATAVNHAFINAFGTGKRFKMWYETAGGFMFGGNAGIVVNVTGEMVLARGAGNVMEYQLIITWVNPNTESRAESPIFGETVLGSLSLDTTILFDTDATPAYDGNDWILAAGINAVASFSYNHISPQIGTAIEMLVKIGGTTVCTANMTADYVSQPFTYKHTTGTVYSGTIIDGNVLF